MSKTESHTTLPQGRSQVEKPGEEGVFMQCEDLYKILIKGGDNSSTRSILEDIILLIHSK